MTHMQQIFDKINYEVGTAQTICGMAERGGRAPFAEEVTVLLNDWSHRILKAPESRSYPDVVTFAFWIRKANVAEMRGRFVDERSIARGRGVAFHIAPSNVAVNYAYSLAAGLLTGNANIVRVPSKDFPQIRLLNRTLSETLEEYRAWQEEICLVRYGHDQAVNDALSQLADTRIIWGGDVTIREIRKSPLKARAFDVCFADRYSLAVVDVWSYLHCEDKEKAALDFYNDTYLTDQNACTSPRMVVWYAHGASAQEQAEAAELFWRHLWEQVEQKYAIRPIQAVNKLTTAYLAAAGHEEWRPVRADTAADNRLVRIAVSKLDGHLMDYRENSGFFYEYVCDDLRELLPVSGSRCQTIGYLGDPGMFDTLLSERFSGIDRIVPIGRTMDFDLIWDGYHLYEMLTRKVIVR